MQSAIGSALRTALNPIARPACRIVGGTRYLSRRTFHGSTVLYRIPDNQGGRDSEGDGTVPEAPKPPEGENVEGVVADASSSLADTDNSTVAKTGRKTKSRLRSSRQRQPQGLPPVVIPDWFWERNVKLLEDPITGGAFSVYGKNSLDVIDRTIMIEGYKPSHRGIWSLPPVETARYTVHETVFREIMATLNAGLTLRPPHTEKSVLRPVTLLHCPNYDGTCYLDSLMEEMASQLQADLVRVDAQDIAQIVGPYVDENVAWTDFETSYLGYSASKAAGRLETYRRKEEPEPNDRMEELNALTRKYRDMALPKGVEKHLPDRPGSGSASRRSPGSGGSALPVVCVLGLGSDDTPLGLSKPGSDWQGLKVATALDALVGAADSKPFRSTKPESAEAVDANAPTRNLIIQVKGYHDLSETRPGPKLLRALRSVIDKRWRDGSNIILVGTAASNDLGASKLDITQLLFEDPEAETRTILVPPERKEENDIAFRVDELARIRNINIRHIQDMIMKLKDGDKIPDSAIDIERNLDSRYSVKLEVQVLSYASVRRLATVIVGYDPPPTRIDGDVVGSALDLLFGSDKVKYEWGAAELKAKETVKAGISLMKDTHKNKLYEIRRTCNSYEKRLLGGVRIPSEIKTSYLDVHAPPETLEALEDLTSLSLARPEAFSYGVLARDKIPGVLLYGPPGTGKTLLAAAVAKDSGAIVLEVSGASVNDMYVGEGEKNVKAIFTLAKKLSPCVIFIDEADGLLAERSSGSKQSTTHREVINQFLREWDSMSDHAAFMMVATNRPYDLDDAVLRRLPRRLLVDLPLENDRAAILNLHLKNEVLDPAVSIAKIAKATPYYSGSDLKNLCVAAAMACLRDEMVGAMKRDEPKPYSYPEKRTLTNAHFDRAIDEISASISDDMSTLKAIRKFDERYGDRKRRRKKSTALGFGGTATEEIDSEAARVRRAVA